MKTMTTLTETVETPKPKKIEEKRPWHGSIEHPVPWDLRTYCLNIDTGRVEVLHEGFLPTRDPIDHKVMRVTKVERSLENPQGYPTMSKDDVDRLYDESEKSGDSFKLCYARLFGLDALTGKQQSKLAVAPDAYAAKVSDFRKAEAVNTSEKLKALQDAAAKARPGINPEPVKSEPVKSGVIKKS